MAHWHHLSVGVAIRLVRVYAFFELGNLLQGIQSLGLLVHDLGMVGLSFRVRETAHPIDSSSARYLIRDREGGENPNPRPFNGTCRDQEVNLQDQKYAPKKVEVKRRESTEGLWRKQRLHTGAANRALLWTHIPRALSQAYKNLTIHHIYDKIEYQAGRRPIYNTISQQGSGSNII